ncbi:signal peptide peptidase SppA [Saliphagus infecundisoli]|uniref:Signal peptide peptidase SppA n=1 Tax=Saliphagus infecundisoli TaxID=1849069 RepID=A0ABD5QET2_9EURY|nr:signal peptide peptidase SppA [Saliphagus infecundisoli]
MSSVRSAGRITVVAAVAGAVALAGIVLFWWLPDSTVELAGIVLTLGLAVVGVRVGGSIADSVFPGYDVAEVAVEGPITRDGGGGGLPSSPRGTGADEVVSEIERADASNAEALIVRLNTPGGQVVPSEDIRLAAAEFDGPTIAYATDVCASGGYWIASGCDELWAREASIVGSIGVVGSRVNASELADKLGLSYEGFTAGEYKDAGVPLKEMDDDERAYLQGLIDDSYAHFVERVSEGRGLDPEFVRETEARVYLGSDAVENGLVDELGTREAVEERVADRLGREDVAVEEFEPSRSLVERMGTGARGVAYAFGAGLAGLVDRGSSGFRFRL